MGQPTAGQMKEYWTQVVDGRITSRHFQVLLDGITLTSFTHRVNYDDTRWKTIDSKRYPYYCNSSATVEKHFPNTRTGVADVVYEYVSFDHEPTTEEVMLALKEAGLDRPDRAETDTFLDENRGELAKYPVVGICGTESGGYVGYVYEVTRGRSLGLGGLRSRWGQRCRFLGVRRK